MLQYWSKQHRIISKWYIYLICILIGWQTIYALWPQQTRTHCGSNIVTMMLPICGKTRQHSGMACADTRSIAEVFQDHFFCPGYKIYLPQCCVWGKMSQNVFSQCPHFALTHWSPQDAIILLYLFLSFIQTNLKVPQKRQATNTPGTPWNLPRTSTTKRGRIWKEHKLLSAQK